MSLPTDLKSIYPNLSGDFSDNVQHTTGISRWHYFLAKGEGLAHILVLNAALQSLLCPTARPADKPSPPLSA